MARVLSAIPLTDFFKFSIRPFGSTTRGHSWKLIKAHTNTDTRLYFFSSRVLNRWNSLPQEAVSLSTVNIFKGHLERTRWWKWVFFHGPNAALCIHVYNVQLWLSGAWTIWSTFDLKLYIGAANLVRYITSSYSTRCANCYVTNNHQCSDYCQPQILYRKVDRQLVSKITWSKRRR